MRPLDEWSAPDRTRVYGLRAWLKAAAFACAAGALIWGVAWRTDWSGVRHSRAELARATARAAAIPAVPESTRIAAAFTPVPLADLLMQLTRMTEESGLRLRTLERAPAEKAASAMAERKDESAAAPRFRVIVSGDLPAMRAWLSSLPSLPALVVPMMLEARREADGGALEANLQVFPGLPGAADGMQPVKRGVVAPIETADATATRERAPPDPFGWSDAAPVAEPVPGHWQLAGVLRDAHHGLALFEQSGETRVLARGHALDVASLKSVEARGVLLAMPGGRVRRIPLRGQVMP